MTSRLPALLALPVATACVSTGAEERASDDGGARYVEQQATVRVDFAAAGKVVPEHLYGMHTSVYDNALHDPNLPELVKQAGLGLFRYPGGGYSDNYHFSNHSMSAWSDGNRGYLAAGSDFGSYVAMAERAGVALMITVNYGSNLDGTGPGEPKEAAAWVAYTNGAPEDETELGEDSVGNDWRTVGYWATLRASAPLGDGSEHDFLRIDHPEPLAVEYWEIGNEVFGNGYYSVGEFELDLHLPYDGTPRRGHPALSPRTYGKEVVRYVEAMKAVDPDIRIGAVLNTPPRDLNWGPDWNEAVLRECGEHIDFGIVHWYTFDNPAKLLTAVEDEMPVMTARLRDWLEEFGGEDHERIELLLTETGPGLNYPRDGAAQPIALFAADTYLSAAKYGIANVDWLELHNGSFLSERSPAKGPAYNGIQLASTLAKPGDTLLDIDSSHSFIQGHASRREGSAAVLLYNRAERHVGHVSVELEGLQAVASRGELFVSEPDEAHQSGAVAGPREVVLRNGRLELELPPYTMLVVRFEADF